MRLIHALLFLLLNLYGFSQEINLSCTAPDAYSESMRESAAQLAVRRIFEMNSPATANIFIDEVSIDSIHSALNAIYNLNIPERDTIIDLLQIRTFNPQVTSIQLEIDTSTVWYDAWREGITLTGDSIMDSLLVKFNLTVSSGFVNVLNSGITGGTLTAAEPLNLEALADTFLTIEGIENAQPNTLFGEDNDIQYKMVGNVRILTYSNGWGDCPAGCSFHRYWEFKVYPDCSAEFIRAYGYPYGYSYNALPIKNSLQLVIASPNPFTNFINVQVNKNNKSINRIRVFDCRGTVVYNQMSSAKTVQITSNEWQPGFYYMVIRNSEKQEFIKLIKIE